MSTGSSPADPGPAARAGAGRRREGPAERGRPPAERAPAAFSPRFLRRRRAEAITALAPIAAAFLLMPPFIGIFAHDGRTFGAPSVLIFLLAVWAGLILATRLVARRLARRDPEP